MSRFIHVVNFEPSVHCGITRHIEKIESSNSFDCFLVTRSKFGFYRYRNGRLIRQSLLSILRRVRSAHIVAHDYRVAIGALVILRPISSAITLVYHGWEGKCPIPKSVKWKKQLVAWCFLNRGVQIGEFQTDLYGYSLTEIQDAVYDSDLGEPKEVADRSEDQSLGSRRLFFVGRDAPDSGFDSFVSGVERLCLGPSAPSNIVIYLSQIADYRRDWLKEKFPGDLLQLHVGAAFDASKLSSNDVIVCTGYLGMCEAIYSGLKVGVIEGSCPCRSAYLRRFSLIRHVSILKDDADLEAWIKGRGSFPPDTSEDVNWADYSSSSMRGRYMQAKI